MNERIEQLARQCTEYITGTLDGDFEKFDYKKFAELLISEVMNVVRDEVQYEYDWALADIVTERVKKEFGV
jgi:hypothetical protein